MNQLARLLHSSLRICEVRKVKDVEQIGKSVLLLMVSCLHRGRISDHGTWLGQCSLTIERQQSNSLVKPS